MKLIHSNITFSDIHKTARLNLELQFDEGDLEFITEQIRESVVENFQKKNLPEVKTESPTGADIPTLEKISETLFSYEVEICFRKGWRGEDKYMGWVKNEKNMQVQYGTSINNVKAKLTTLFADNLKIPIGSYEWEDKGSNHINETFNFNYKAKNAS